MGVTVLARMPGPGRSTRCAVEIDLRGAPAGSVLKQISAFSSVGCASFSPPAGGIVRGFVESIGCRACPAATQTGVFVLKSEPNGRGTLEWSVLSPNRARLSDLLAVLEMNGCETQLRKIGPLGMAQAITPRQLEVLRMARSRGYFDDPRRVTLGELARDLGVSRTAVLRVLRRAERNALPLS